MPPRANVADYLLEGHPADAVALRMPGRDHTYGELSRAVDRLARSLAQSEPRQTPVLLVAGNSFFWVAAYLGILKAGLICAPLPASISGGDLRRIAQRTGARRAFAPLRTMAGRASGFEGLAVTTDSGPGGAPAVDGAENAAAPTPTAPDDLAALMFTSGSTAEPRGVMLSHANIVANTESILQYLPLASGDRMMTVLPFHYCYGASLLHTHLRAGASLVIEHRFLYPEVVLQRMIEARCTGFAGVPSHFQILLRRSQLRRMSFPHLHHVQQAGGRLAPAYVRELRQALPHAAIFLMYGQTEATARLSCLPPELLDSKPGSIGRGIPGVRLQVLGPSGQPVAPGEVGEIVAEGPNLMRGYWRDPESTAQALRGGRLHTGDLATVDSDGFLYIVDREKDFLKCGGVRVSCRQIEDELAECEGLLEAAVVGVPDGVLGECVKAFVVTRQPSCQGPCRYLSCRRDIAEVERFCRERLHRNLAPREIVLMPALPKNGAWKVIRRELKAL